MVLIWKEEWNQVAFGLRNTWRILDFVMAVPGFFFFLIFFTGEMFFWVSVYVLGSTQIHLT